MTRARDLANVADDVSTGTVVTTASPSLGRRNLIINGAMQVAQRGTSVTGSTASVSYLCLDRWATHDSGGTYNVSQQEVTLGGETGLPSQFRYFQRYEATTGANNMGLYYHVEDVKSVQGTFTLSFYAKGTNPSGGSLAFEHRPQYSSSTSGTQYDTNFSITSEWTRYSFTFTPDSLSGQSITDSNSSYRFAIKQPTEDDTSNAWTLDITGVQLEVGSVATPFEHRSYGEELAACQRYYQAMLSYDRVYGFQYNSSFKGFVYQYFCQMRSTPSITRTDVGGNSTAGTITENSLFRYVSSGTADGTAYYFHSLTLDAEL
jgi:hypothetical protein